MLLEADLTVETPKKYAARGKIVVAPNPDMFLVQVTGQDYRVQLGADSMAFCVPAKVTKISNLIMAAAAFLHMRGSFSEPKI